MNKSFSEGVRGRTLFRCAIAKEVFIKLNYKTNTADYVNRLFVIRKSVCFAKILVIFVDLCYNNLNSKIRNKRGGFFADNRA